MTQREFERALVKTCPTVHTVIYDRRTFGKREFFYDAVYVYWKTPKGVACCHLEQSNDVFVATLNFFKELADAPK